MKQKAFITNNEQKANNTTTNIMLWANLAFPALIILGWLKVFSFDMTRLYIFCSIGMVGALSPFVLKKSV
ncbi:hypothetical protein [Acetivibrio cellulolyticus]|uniref:hypothetical protein n=1 Tax=Acetivibrio cellulolyticus TaxID=35830 RepID=UPI0001E2F131|nr:hypothetical protein [Acetivibrio cellulolyticus]